MNIYDVVENKMLKSEVIFLINLYELNTCIAKSNR